MKYDNINKLTREKEKELEQLKVLNITVKINAYRKNWIKQEMRSSLLKITITGRKQLQNPQKKNLNR